MNILSKWQNVVSRLLPLVVRHKNWIALVVFFVCYTMFWWWFFGERNMAINDSQISNGDQGVVVVSEPTEKREEYSSNDDTDNQFTEFGDFWLEIDTANVRIKAPIVNGVTDEKLAQGIGHHKTTAYPNNKSGNVVLSGHRWKFGNNPAYKVFEDLDQLKVGDNVTVFYQGNRFVYRIASSKTVGSKAVEILRQTEQPTLTLYTCTPKYTSFRRLVYVATLVN